MEMQRISCVAPSGLEHKALENSVLEGYRIPKGMGIFFTLEKLNTWLCLAFYFDLGTNVYYSIYKFHTDPEYWGDPETFRPERFLAEDGQTILKKERFIPFGFGKRVCMGESLAKAELFIFSVIMLQTLRIGMPKSGKRPDPDDNFAGITRSPNPYSISIATRIWFE